MTPLNEFHFREGNRKLKKKIKRVTQWHTVQPKDSWPLDVCTKGIFKWIIFVMRDRLVHWRVLSNILGLCQMLATALPTSCSNQKCLQTLRDVPWGGGTGSPTLGTTTLTLGYRCMQSQAWVKNPFISPRLTFSSQPHADSWWFFLLMRSIFIPSWDELSLIGCLVPEVTRS